MEKFLKLTLTKVKNKNIRINVKYIKFFRKSSNTESKTYIVLRGGNEFFVDETVTQIETMIALLAKRSITFADVNLK